MANADRCCNVVMIDVPVVVFFYRDVMVKVLCEAVEKETCWYSDQKRSDQLLESLPSPLCPAVPLLPIHTCLPMKGCKRSYGLVTGGLDAGVATTGRMVEL